MRFCVIYFQKNATDKIARHLLCQISMLHCCFLQICLEEILFAIIDLLFLLLAVQVCRWSSVCLFEEIGFRQNFGV